MTRKNGRKPKVPDAPRAGVTLRNFDVGDWRWPIPDGTRLRMSRRVGVGMPEEMREAVEEAAKRSGFSMSEVGRRCFRLNIINRVIPPRKGD